MDIYECCETCGIRINDFKIIDVELEPYIICQSCFNIREEISKFQQQWMRNNNITMKEIEKEVKKEVKLQSNKSNDKV